MNPHDPRHGTEAGHEQHLRDGEQPCHPCVEADLLAARRRSKRRTMGHQFTRPIGTKLHTRLTELRDTGARVEDIAEWTGLASSQICRILAGGPDKRVYARTWLAIANMIPGRVITHIGTQRRLRALACLGWSPERIAAHTGLHADTLRDARNTNATLIYESRKAIADVYERLSMLMPPTETIGDKRGVGNVRGHAARAGWAPPLAWDDDTIDDPKARPRGGTKRTRKTDIDPVVVDRLLAGERINSTKAERDEAMRRWVAAGNSGRSLCLMHGWHQSRYGRIA